MPKTYMCTHVAQAILKMMIATNERELKSEIQVHTVKFKAKANSSFQQFRFLPSGGFCVVITFVFNLLCIYLQVLAGRQSCHKPTLPRP